MSRLLAILWLAFVWVLLFESYDLAAVIGGLVVGTALVLGFPAERRRSLPRFRPLQMLLFLVRFLGLAIKANAIVAWEVMTPGENINEGIVEIPVTGSSDAVVSLLAICIQLTPGTLVVEVVREPETLLYIHVLHLRDIDAVRLDIFNLERGLARALGTEANLRQVDLRIERLIQRHPHLATGRRATADHHPGGST